MNMDNMIDQFQDRYDAGRMLAKKLKIYANEPDTIVLALPRGGVPVAYEIAISLSLPLDVYIVRKLGVPGQTELAMGAIAMDETIVFNQAIISEMHISKNEINSVIEAERDELQRREKKYRKEKPMPDLANQIIILVDDGIATGATMRAAIQAIQSHKPKKIIVAIPVAAKSICDELRKSVDDMVCLKQLDVLHAVGEWYHDFSQTSDNEVDTLLNKSFF
jgi:putative phosphoribosyl transferase